MQHESKSSCSLPCLILTPAEERAFTTEAKGALLPQLTYLLIELVDAPPLVPVLTLEDAPELDFVRSDEWPDPWLSSGRTVPEPDAVPLAPIAPLPLVEPDALQPASKTPNAATTTTYEKFFIARLLKSERHRAAR